MCAESHQVPGAVDKMSDLLDDGSFMFTSESVGEGHPGEWTSDTRVTTSDQHPKYTISQNFTLTISSPVHRGIDSTRLLKTAKNIDMWINPLQVKALCPK